MKLIVMFVLGCNILIGNYKFDQVHGLEITHDWRELGDYATIKLPSLSKQLEKVFKVGDPVSITLSYVGVQEKEEFNGFVSKINPTIPFELECEDHIFNCKRTTISNTWKATSLKEIVQYIADQVNSERGTSIEIHGSIPTIEMSKYRINKINAAQALQKLKEEYGLAAYFRGDVLFVGIPYTDKLDEVKYSTSWNVIEDDLTFRKSEDVSIKLNPIGITPDNKKIELDKPVGDADGDERVWYFYNITDAATLKKLAEAKLSDLKYDGMEGTITGFLVPYAEHGMSCSLQDPDYNDGRTGVYHVDSVVVTFGVNGSRRKIELGPKLNSDV